MLKKWAVVIVLLLCFCPPVWGQEQKISDIYQEQADNRMSEICFKPFESLPETLVARFAVDDFTGEKKFVYSYEIINAEPYLAGKDGNLNQWMAKWLNLGKLYIHKMRFPFSETRMPFLITRAEINNFPGVKNPLLIAFHMNIIQMWSSFSEDSLLALIDELDNNALRFDGLYREAYLTNPANYLARANLYMTIATLERIRGRRSDYVDMAVELTVKANELFNQRDSVFFVLFDKMYGQAGLEIFERQYVIALRYALLPDSMNRDLEILLPVERRLHMGQNFLLPVIEHIMATYELFNINDLHLNEAFMRQMGLVVDMY